MCMASGPGKDMFESTKIIGRKQFEVAVSLLEKNDTAKLKGGVAYRHAFINMANLSVALENGTVGCTCPAALGYSFAGGTTDGPG